MPFLTPQVADERDALAGFLEQQCAQLRLSALDLDDEAARRPLLPEGLSVAGLLVHTAQVIASWLERVRVAPEPLPQDRLFELGRELGLADRFFSGAELPEDMTLHEILTAYDRATARIRPVVEGADPETRVPVPEAPWFPKDLESWSVRWVCHHLIAEVARHAGHADLIRESIDGEIAYSLNARAEGEPFDWDAYGRVRE
ncbi:MAG: DUF664 domain-containing protein [Pseudoclavibacter sp.]|nr:DUF664 domain-containing protein [Pseudoclavibacter sp.]